MAMISVTVTTGARQTSAFTAKALSILLLTGLVTLPTNPANAQRNIDLRNLSFEAFALSESLPASLPVDTPSSSIASGNDSNQSILQNINQYQETIDELLSAEGPFASDLTEHLQAQARLYEELGDHAAAIIKLDEAIHIVRINNGLFILDQTQLIESLIENYTALDNFEEVDKYHGYLFYLHQRNYSHEEPEMIAATLDWAQWNIDAYLQAGREYNPRTYGAGGILVDDGIGDYVAVQDPATYAYYFVPRNRLDMGTLNTNNLIELNRNLRSEAVATSRVIDPHLSEAQHQFELLEELSATLETNNLGPISTRQLQLKLADTAFQIKNQIASMESGSNTREYNISKIRRYSPNLLVRRSDLRSREALEQIITNLQGNPNTPALEITEAIVNLADWQLAFEHPQQAFNLYQEAYEKLSAANLTDLEINSFLTPKPLIVVPAFSTHPFTNTDWAASATPPTNYIGYLDVEFRYNRGKARAVRVIDSTENTPTSVRRILLHQLRTQIFRPRIIDGQIETSADYSLRFYYTY